MSQNLKYDTTSEEYRRFLLNYARQRIASKNFYDADFALQVSQSRYPNDAVSYNLQAMLAYRMGLYEYGLFFVKKSLEIDPSLAKAQENLTTIEKAYYADQAKQSTSQSKQSTSEEKFFLINSWGSGLGFDLLYLMQQLLLAELSERQPVIYWGGNSLYNDQTDRDCFAQYFESVNALTIDDVTAYLPDVYPLHWQKRNLKDYIRRTRWRNTRNNQQYKIGGAYFLNRPEKLVVGGEYASVGMLRPWLLADNHRYADTKVGDIYRDLVRRYIRPKQHLYDKANAFIQKNFADQAYIAIHLRGTDKHNEKQSSSIENINHDLIQQVKNSPDHLPIFLMTDDKAQLSLMQAMFSERLYSFNFERSDNQQQGMHYTSKNKSKMTEDVILDMLVATRSSHFYGCGLSYLACMVSYMQASKNSSTLLPFDVMTRFVDIPMPS